MPRSFLALPAAATAAALLVAGCTGSTDGKPPGPSGSGAASGSTSGGSASCELDGGYLDPNDGYALSKNMTAAIQAKDEKAFVAIAANDDAKSGMTRWWDNISALGFTTGAVGIVDTPPHKGGDLTITVGAHSGLDSIDDADDKALPKVPAAQYQVTVERTGSDCKTPKLTAWEPIQGAPWDTIPKLYVKKTDHVVVAGDPAVKKSIDRVAALGEKAALWDREILKQGGHLDYMEQKGFVVFVARTNAQADGWFRAKGSPQPHGWTADSSNVAGTEFPLGAATAPVGVKFEHEVSGLPTGGSRVIITPTGLHAGDTELEGTLVHEFVHDIFRVNDLWSWASGDPVEASTAEGAARWVEAMYLSHPGLPTKNARVRSLDALKPTIQKYKFAGRMPSDSQVYGNAKYANYWYDVSASGFSYLAAAYGIKFAFQCVRDAYLQGGGPFGGVVDSIKGGTITFEASDKVQARWASWVRGGFSETNVPK